MNIKNLFPSLLLTLVLSVSISGCGQKKEPEPEKRTETTVNKPATTEKNEKTERKDTEISGSSSMVSERSELTETQDPENQHIGQARSYLTGTWIDEKLVSQRPVAIMVENTSPCLPQYNIAKADIIYESAVEGGITRLMAIFQDYRDMERIGNVRSCRKYYIYFAREFEAIYIHAGQSSYATSLLNSDFIDNINGIEGVAYSSFYRTNDREMPHNFYTSSKGIDKAIDALSYSRDLPDSYEGHYRFAEDGQEFTATQGTDANSISLYYPNPKAGFTYNPQTKLYERFEFGKPQIDGVSGEQLAVKNILLQNCNSWFEDSTSGTLAIDCVSGGTGTYITNGKAIPITWSRASDKAPTKYFDQDGNEITMNQGKTWVCIIQNEFAGKNKILAQ